MALERQSLGRPRRLVHWLERLGRGLEPGLGRLRRVMAQERLRATDGATSLAFARRLFRGGVSAAVSVSETSPRVTEHTECGKKGGVVRPVYGWRGIWLCITTKPCLTRDSNLRNLDNINKTPGEERK